MEFLHPWCWYIRKWQSARTSMRISCFFLRLHWWRRLAARSKAASPSCRRGTVAISTRWWFHIFFYFHPKPWGRWTPFWRAYFSNGSKPPTSQLCLLGWLIDWSIDLTLFRCFPSMGWYCWWKKHLFSWDTGTPGQRWKQHCELSEKGAPPL